VLVLVLVLVLVYEMKQEDKRHKMKPEKKCVLTTEADGAKPTQWH
jgi:hypothetical protein